MILLYAKVKNHYGRSMKHFMLAAATLLLISGVDARERRGPPPLCPQPKVDCCAKPKPCPPKECKPKAKPCQPECPKPCETPCPPVCFERGFPTDPCCTPSAYNEAAAIDLLCGWDTFITANFIYWETMQGGMELAIPGQGTIAGGVLTLPAESAVGKKLLVQDFEYKPGFQVGLGWSGGKDHWTLYAEYTWLHGTTHTSANAPAPGVESVNGVALPQNGIWFPTSWLGNYFINENATSISSSWKYKIDLIDAQISRPYYSGTRFLVEPFFGLRGALIRQHLDLTANTLATTDVATPSATREVDYQSRAAGIGPRVGVNGNWHLGYGIRFIGNAAASVLFTGYDVKQNIASPDATGTFRFPQSTKIDDYNALRPSVDLSLGLGWGSYLNCRRFHMDLAATYDFSVFFEQNMMRYLADITSYASSGAACGNLYLQGLTVETRFDF
jgi:hypothetical protein